MNTEYSEFKFTITEMNYVYKTLMGYLVNFKNSRKNYLFIIGMRTEI